MRPSYKTLTEAFIGCNALYKEYVHDGQLDSGRVALLKPAPSLENSPYTVDSVHIKALSDLLQQEGMTDFKFIDSGVDAIVFKAHNTRYNDIEHDPKKPRRAQEPYFRIHLGPPNIGRECPDVIPSLKTRVIGDAITCEEVEYMYVPKPCPFDYKIVLALGISCLADGWIFQDWDGPNNVIMRLSNTRVGVLEPHAVHKLYNRSDEFINEHIETFALKVGDSRLMRDQLRAQPQLREAIHQRFSEPYTRGDVVETQSNTVVLLNGDFYACHTRGRPEQHPCLQERRALVKRILNEEGCDDYKVYRGGFMVIPQPAMFPPDHQALCKSMRLAEKLRKALDEHEQARLQAAKSEAISLPGSFGERVSALNAGAASIGK